MSFGPFPIPFKLDRTRAASVQVYEHLRELITTLALEPGTQLDRAELAAYFKLSSTPVRDALTRLGEEDLVEIFPQHATMVRAISAESVREAHFLRLSLELELVARLAREPGPEPGLGLAPGLLAHELESLVSQQAFALSRQDYDAFVRLDMAFHQHLFHAAGVDELWHFLRSKSGNLDRLRRLHVPLKDKGKAILAGHAAIAGAIAAGDGAMAQACVREHLSGTLAQLDALMARYPGFFVPACGPEAP
jgi:GntR family transcriptional regulator, rspAB operon transcriptional repressor